MKTNTGHQTEVLHRQISVRPEIEEHPIGHTSKVYRYRTTIGHEVAIEKRKGNPIIYVAASAVRNVPTSLAVTTVGAGRTGRNSNLNALPTFRDRPLLRLEVRTVIEADELLRRLG